MNSLLKHNIRLVIKYAKKYSNQGLEFQDLIQEGLMGFKTGVEKFDLSRNLKLSTYATWWIRQHITRALDTTSRLVRVPINRLNELRTLRKLYGQFRIRYGKPPGPDELVVLVQKASELDPNGKIKPMTREEVEFLGRMLHTHSYLDESNSEDENLKMVDFLEADESLQPEVMVEVSTNKKELNNLLAHLSPDERVFILLKFGLMDGKERDKSEMAAFNRLPEEEVQEKLNTILEKMRKIAVKERINLDW